MLNNKKRLPVMEDYKNIQYYGMPVYNKKNQKMTWFCQPAEPSDGSGKKYPWPSQDGTLFSLQNSDGLYQLYEEDHPAVVLPFGVSDYAFSPDEKWIFLTSWDAPYSTDFTEPVCYESHPFKSDADLGFKVKRNPTLWLYEREAERLTCLIDGSDSFSRPVWLPDSSGILYQKTNEEGRLSFYTVTPADRKPTLLLSASNVIPCLDNKSGMQFSQDGKTLFFAANLPGDEFADPPALYQISICSHKESSAEAIPLVHPDHNKNGVFTNGFPFYYKEEKIQTFVILPDDRCIYLAPKNGSVCVFEVSITDRGNSVPHQITEAPHNFHSLTSVSEEEVLALHTDPTHLPEIVLLSLKDGNFRTLTDNNNWIRELSLTPAISHWIGKPGTASHTQGFYIPPHDLDPAKKYPAILCCHGGPTGFYSTALDLEFQTLSANGFAVMYVNPRGSTGYGSIHSQDDDAYNGNAALDLESFVKEMCRLYPYIDPDRIGVCGGSYGGYMTTYLASHNRLFKAASAHRPLLNWQMIGYASHSAGCMHTKKAFPDFTDYIKECLKVSPTTCGQQITIPFQIQQSLRDANCIPEQVFQLYATIKNFHPEVPCRMVLYPGSGHSLLSRGPLSLAIQHRKDNLEWMKQYL